MIVIIKNLRLSFKICLLITLFFSFYSIRVYALEETTDLISINLTVETDESQIYLNWDTVEEADYYIIKRSVISEGSFINIVESIKHNSYTDSSLVDSIVYYYEIVAIKEGNEIASSTEISASLEGTYNNNRAFLVITMIDGRKKEYDVSIGEIKDFIRWYNDIYSGIGPTNYTFSKSYNLGPYTNKVENIYYGDILLFEVKEYLGPPKRFRFSSSDTSIDISWDEVPHATSYEIEIDGGDIIEVENENYVHEVLTLNNQHYYRVRAINEIMISEWSEVKSYINWNNEPALAFSNENWVFDTTQDRELNIILKGNALQDIYTAQFELNYDPKLIKIDDNTVKNLFNLEELSYLSYEINEGSGKIKVLVSNLGNQVGKDGEINYFQIDGTLLLNQAALSMSEVILVTSQGEFIEIEPAQPLIIKELIRER
ncbi:cohesin domain-containing protein [Chengkuizengella sediminis]|uniref:cohesin domain-containing protein n=1 Tax=Chengkuizengella sediminis TaxID=1885917 RepID=UPI0013894C71|nr:cohesin domain-containing protein [Chengkuizengella sediminis]NDI36497.1 hypothetical protein [Chengkuizengella sediminis]